MFDRFREERGIAMVTALLVSMVVLSLSVAVVGISLHNSSQSSQDRKRVQAIDAAEAGIDAYFSGLVSTPTGSGMCDLAAWDGTLPTSPAAEYDVSVVLYSTWPPIDGTEITCADPLSAPPLGARIISKGTAVTSASGVAVSRTMQTEVQLAPIYGGLNQAIFSDRGLNFQNKFTLNGYKANDGDVYTNGDFVLRNNTTIAGSVYSQGTADIQSGAIKQDVWANKAVTLDSISVFGKVTSSISSVSVQNNSHIYGDIKAGTGITVSNNSVVDGSKTPNSPSGPPPQLPFPQLTYDDALVPPTGATAWTSAGYTVVNYTNCALAKAFIGTIAGGNYAVHISPTCALSWGGNTTVNVRGNLAIITDGSISTINNVTFQGVGGTRTVFLIDPYRTGVNVPCPVTNPTPYDISVSNSTSFNSINLFVYTPCNVSFGNNNANGVNAQIIGGTVNITNQMVMNFKPIQVPAFNLTGYSVQVSYLREITNQ